MTSSVEYRNPRTGRTWPVTSALWRAPDDGEYVNLTPGGGISRDDIETRAHSLWRYRAALRLPAAPERTLGEGWTPLVEAAWDGVPVLMKMEFLMPSGSFKDRGTAVMLNYLKQVGVTDILADSSGNAGASVATYAAALGMRSRIFVPASTPAPKRRQMAAMGAAVVPIEGSRDDVAAAALEAADAAFYAGHNRQPFFLEGTKTLAFEIWEQLGFCAPDNILIPMGQGSNVMGCHIGFGELVACGGVTAMPRIFGVQAMNAAPYYAAYAAGSDEPVPITPARTIADGIAAARPIRLQEVLQAVRESGGALLAVDESEIIRALRDLLHIGFFVEPTTAAATAGLRRLIADGVVRPGETTVVVLTGSGLKAAEEIAQTLRLDSA